MSTLNARPARSYCLPKFPTRLQIREDPELLRRHVPTEWLSRQDIAGVLGLALAAQAGGCADGVRSGHDGASVPDVDGPRAALVAPLFVHGEGRGPSRGAMGCIAVAAPVFLSEEEALDVITDAMAEYGVQLTHPGAVLDSVIIEGREFDYGCAWPSKKNEQRCRPVREPLETDLSDPVHNVSVEYVTPKDFDRLGGNDEGQWSQDLKLVAEKVAHHVRTDGKDVCFGVFYDPVVYSSFGFVADSEDRWASSPDEARARAARLLRQQVQDFAQWLQAQGII